MTPIERLVHLRQVAEEFFAKYPKNWDMAHFGAPECGSPGCLLGLAVGLPEFQKEGFGRMTCSAPVYQRIGGIDAASAFFDLSRKEVKYVFGYDFDDNRRYTQAAVFARFDKIIAAKQREDQE